MTDDCHLMSRIDVVTSGGWVVAGSAEAKPWKDGIVELVLWAPPTSELRQSLDALLLQSSEDWSDDRSPDRSRHVVRGADDGNQC